MKKKKRKVEETYYVAFDGTEFSNIDRCIHYEKIKKGEKQVCYNCAGSGEIQETMVVSKIVGGGIARKLKHANKKCKNCSGKGYLELKEVWE